MADRVAAFSLQRNSHLSSPSTSNNAETFSPSSGLKVRSFCLFRFLHPGHKAGHGIKS